MLEATWPKFPRDREFYSCQGLRCWWADSCWDGANLQGVTRSDSLARISEASTSAVHLERPGQLAHSGCISPESWSHDAIYIGYTLCIDKPFLNVCLHVCDSHPSRPSGSYSPLCSHIRSSSDHGFISAVEHSNNPNHRQCSPRHRSPTSSFRLLPP